MGIRKSITDMILAAGGWEDAAFKLGMSVDGLRNRVYGKKGSVFQIEHAMALQVIAGAPLFAQSVAEESGGSFFAFPEVGEIDNDELLTKFQQLLEAFGRLSRRHQEATEDGVVDPQERTDLERIAADMHRSIQELLALTFRIYCKDETAGATALRRVADAAGGH